MKLENKNVLIFGVESVIVKAIAELDFYLMSDLSEIICGHTVVAAGGDNYATL